MMICTRVLLGIFVGPIIWSLIIAFNTWIFGLLLGYQFQWFSFWGMMVLKENGKLKIRFANFSLTAYCGMREVNRTLPKHAAWEIFVSLMGVAVVLFGWLGKRSVTYMQFGMLLSMSVLCISHLISLVRFLFQMFGKSEKSIVLRESQEAMNQLDEGVRPKDLRLLYERSALDIKFKASYMQYELLKYYSALDAKKYEELEKYILEFEEFLPDVWLVPNTPYYYESLFYFCYITGEMQRAETIMHQICDVLSADQDVNGRRVYAYYLYYMGKDKNIALQTAREGLKVVDAYPHRGIAYMERELLQELIYQIESE